MKAGYDVTVTIRVVSSAEPTGNAEANQAWANEGAELMAAAITRVVEPQYRMLGATEFEIRSSEAKYLEPSEAAA